MNISLSAFAPENLVSRDGFGSPVPRQFAYLHTQAVSSEIPRQDFARMHYYLNLCIAIIAFSRVGIYHQVCMVANPAHSQLNRKKKKSLSLSRLKTKSRETGSAGPFASSSHSNYIFSCVFIGPYLHPLTLIWQISPPVYQVTHLYFAQR